jgi:leader peptidase (prepilin peptidase) / N-methyltransferase
MILLLSENTSLLLTVVALFSLMIGSFMNVVIYRLPIILEREWLSDCRQMLDMEQIPYPVFNLSLPRSACPHCNHQISAWENIPVISYLWLRGRCAGCKASISMQYPLVETIVALLSVAVAYRFGFGMPLLAGLLFTWLLFALAMIDLQTMILPDILVYPLLWLGLLVNITETFTPLPDSVIGAVSGYLSLWLVHHLFRLIRGKEGMGQGDFKLLAAAGAWGGWQVLPNTLLIAAVAGLLFAGIRVGLKIQDSQAPMPFGPWLAAGTWISVIVF